ncbi:MAG: DUF2064 domain-containing protein [Dokdonella sp.]
MSGALAIFVKTPGRSALKTRLAAQTGQEYAEQWYRLAADAVASVVVGACQELGLTAYWAVAEAGAEDAWPGLPTIAQGEGGLGTRMARVHSELVRRHGFAMLIGADAPQLSVDAIGQATRWLAGSDASSTAGGGTFQSPRFALGPAKDGGFWLFGGNQMVALEAWTQVRYSHVDTARELLGSMHDLGAWLQLSALIDVDHAEDLACVQNALLALPEATPEQYRLSQWMHTHQRDCP